MKTPSRDRNYYAVIAFNVQLNDCVLTRLQSEKFQEELSTALKRALVDNPLYTIPRPRLEHEIKVAGPVHVIASGSVVCGMFFVSDLERGLATVETELKTANLFAGAEIGWWSPVIDASEEKQWHRYRQEIAASPFIPTILKGQAELIAIVTELEAINPCFAWLPPHPRPTPFQWMCRQMSRILQAVLKLTNRKPKP
jgi:hypothetical protein